MTGRDDEDTLTRLGTGRGASGAQGPRRAPADDPGLSFEEPGRTLAEQRKELQVQVDELQGALRFMGAAHPNRRETEQLLAQVRNMLARLEQELGQKR